MSPDSPTARDADGGAAPSVRRAVEEPDDQGPTYGDILRSSLRSLRGLGHDRVLQTGLLVVLAALLLKAYVLSESYFVEDDYLFFAAAHASDLTPEYLLDLHKGHFMPGAMFLVYLQTAFLPYDWVTSAGTMLVLQGVAVLAFFRLLWELFGRRWAILVPLTVYALAPLTIPVLGWWAAALNAVPFQLAIVLALLWTVRYLRTDLPIFAWWAGAAVAFGMLFSVKALFLPSLMFVFAIAFLYPGSLFGAARYALWRHRTFWSVQIAATLGYLVLYLVRQGASDGTEGAGIPVWEPSVEMVRRMLGQVFPTGAVGGPLEWGPVTPAGGLVEPAGAVVLGAWAVLITIVLASLRLRRDSWRAWALLLGYLVFVDAIPTIIARGQAHGGIGADPRYVADAALIFALVLALAFLATREERARDHVSNAGEGRRKGNRVQIQHLSRSAAAVVVAGTVAYAGAAGYSTHTYAQTLSGDRLHLYLANVRASLEDVPEDAGLYSRPVPTDVVIEWNGPRRLSSYVLPPLADGDLAERIAVPREAPSAHVFDDEGNLVEAAPPAQFNAFVPAADEDCMDSWDGLMSWPVFEVGGIEQVAAIGYVSQERADLVVVVGGEEVRTELPAAPDGGFWYVPVEERHATFTLFTDAAKTCVTWASLGPLMPASEVGEAEEPDEEDIEGTGEDTEDAEDIGERAAEVDGDQ
ncbi:hypothetical protein NE857_07510 [Nocardiopsis exhalans]|uniref:Glycosyltransferase RgtA/B/C/D-like domain-containing protein n=1 Tax=Nocardiopsis exhalans TaxID=163604 RepID=A0ABY5DEF5_9ACTN|nr:hypothetical protein [Nocardiopsis exhalans]USY21448.1 hypothetical protein NE857_07510 [Nocardiopsis exhalans]